MAPWSELVPHGASVRAYTVADVGCTASCPAPNLRTCTDGVLSGTGTFASCAQRCVPCALPWGGSIAHGLSVPSYSAAAGSCDGGCVAVTRTCNDGVLSPGGTFATCAAPGCCTLPWGGVIARGQQVTAYQTDLPTCARTCADVRETRQCTDAGLTGTYTEPSCTPSNGVRLYASCWYYGGLDRSCTDVCANRDGCDLAALRHVGDQAPSDNRCQLVLDAIGTPGNTVLPTTQGPNGGCYYRDAQRWWATASQTSCGASPANARRACACNR